MEAARPTEEISQTICIICGQQREDGIHIISQFICAACEEEIVHTDVQDEKYPFFIHQLRQIWYPKDA
ncbi:Inhibitor of sigma-G Gin [Chlamydia abortus]|uniref:Sigma factor G inhibitor Gin n=1 Tax=Paenibacillus residui TaxID=629724 RepID=A0ABW3DCQ4_9BACL|nr:MULTISPECIES: sigma factor G inhibitor Gin [Paenibacillaceae]SHE15274.1 Inhibitor of sigma-G Gin [Chlamydia abortus]